MSQHPRRPPAAASIGTVLILDDSLTVRMDLVAAFGAAGWTTVPAATAAQAWEVLKRTEVDALVLDVLLPDADGVDVLRQLRDDPATHSLPVLMLSSEAQIKDRIRGLRTGADEYIGEPYDTAYLIARARELIQARAEWSPDVDRVLVIAESTSIRQSIREDLEDAGYEVMIAGTGAEGLRMAAAGVKAMLVDGAMPATLADQVRGVGYDVVPAHSDAEALELLAFQSMDCILLQVSGSDSGDALAMCRWVKSAPGLGDVPLILLGESGQTQTMVEALAAGADDYVLVGDLPVLAARIRAQLRRKQIQDEHRRIRETLLRREIEAAEARAEAEIAQTKAAMVKELERKNLELESFAYLVSHDLRAPLRSIDGFTRALGDSVAEHLDDDGVRHLQRIRSGVSRMAEMINDMLELSRIGRIDLRRTEVDLAGLGSAILSDLAAGDAQRNVTVVVQDRITGSADPRLIRNVLENLLENAWKFTAKREDARVEFGSQEREDGLVYFVRDNGAGFDVCRAGRLFSPFQRYHGQTDFPGTGIGLAIVHRIIERHGGQIWAESEVGQGATFWFTLPT